MGERRNIEDEKKRERNENILGRSKKEKKKDEKKRQKLEEIEIPFVPVSPFVFLLLYFYFSVSTYSLPSFVSLPLLVSNVSSSLVFVSADLCLEFVELCMS